MERNGKGFRYGTRRESTKIKRRNNENMANGKLNAGGGSDEGWGGGDVLRRGRRWDLKDGKGELQLVYSKNTRS